MAYANNYLEMLQPHQNIEKKRERKRIKNNALAVIM